MSEAHQALISQVSAAVQAYQRSTDAFDDLVARELKVNRSDLRCLDYLFGGPMTTSELARATALSLSATTTLVDRLQRRGFVTRVADVTDRRKVMVEMTDDGRRQAGTFYASLAQGGRHILDALSDDALRVLKEFLEAATAMTNAQRGDLER